MADMVLPLVFAITASLCFGMSKFLIRKAMNVTPLVSVFYTFLLAPPILLCFAVVNGDLFLSYEFSLWTMANLVVSALLYLCVGRIFAYASINVVGAARASQLTSTQIIFSAAFSVAFLQEEMTLKIALGTIVIFLGLILISISNPRNEGKDVMPTARFRRGIVLGLAGGVVWGGSQLFLREGVRGLGSSTMASLTSYVFAILIQGSLVLLFARKEFKRQKTQTTYLLLAGVVSTLALLAQYSALRVAPVVWTNPIVNTSPLITLILSYLLIQNVEFINRKVILGAVAVVVGVVLVVI